MKFQLQTLIDVTETNARKGEELLQVNQQANYNTMYNTIGLRTNPTEFKVSVENIDLKGLGFGSQYKGKHNVWTVEFFVEAEESTNINLLINDFDLVPVITGLTETVSIDKELFITSSNPKVTNIIFYEDDK